ncbi:hypothetical protein PORCRE_1774 [Porphyromonas crevioricanis JCM 15906]|uniref:Uncharacterized protein n=1 Tax=Porphyromonas crevioricanis JCM 15906 TaxID=1305617 RepID=T1DTW2_9PORP|nr:hypothetical protein PORCRE_1774 [Porphyromonas crevioricanis JCM 15906]GAD06996.1 hypothetical protein PORCAN_609 [Porphyromonas crevioricanis JCM 13913]
MSSISRDKENTIAVSPHFLRNGEKKETTLFAKATGSLSITI